MNMVEKAVEYDKALARAKEWMEGKYGHFVSDTPREIAEFIFPELKESEEEADNRIGRDIIQCLKGTMPDNEYRREYITWIEKQCKQNKTTDKAEVKFNVGDWIVIKDATYQITRLEYYNVVELSSMNGKSQDVYDIDVLKDARLWTIKDAKPGNVLAIDWKDGDGASKWQKIVIFESLNENGVEGWGGTFKKNRNFALVSNEDFPYHSKTWSKYLQPASKEQCKILFRMLKEKGYEWDAEKKRLMYLLDSL